MRLDDVAGDGQAQTRASAAPDPRPIHLVETLEDSGQIRPGYADARISDPHTDAALVFVHANHDLTSVRAELHRVVEQVD